MTDADSKPRRHGRQRALGLFALAAAAAGIIIIVIALLGQDEPSSVPPGGVGTIDAAPPSASPSAPEPSPAAVVGPSDDTLEPSIPVSISIPAIDVQSEMIVVGKNPDGTIEVPRGANLNKVAWYKHSVTPGEIGPSVIEGHIDTVQGPSVFLHLADLRPGDTVSVKRKDGKTAVFTVNAVKGYPSESQFPTKLVYGGDLSKATLRIVTCSNFNETTRHYEGNTIVFAGLTSIRPASG